MSSDSKGNSDFSALRKTEQTNLSILCQNSQDAQDNSISSTLDIYNESNNLPEVLDCRIAEKIKSEMEQKLGIESEILKTKSDKILCLSASAKIKIRSFQFVNDNETLSEKKTKKLIARSNRDTEEYQVQSNGKSSLKISKVKPEGSNDAVVLMKLNEEIDDENTSELIDSERDVEYDFGSVDNNTINECYDEEDEHSVDSENEPQTFNFCRYCSEIHAPEECPFRTCHSHIEDKIDFTKWTEKYSITENKTIKMEITDAGDKRPLHELSLSIQTSFSERTLPDEFKFKLSNAQICGVIAKLTVPKFTKLGPLFARKIAEVDISDDCTMKFIIEAYDGSKSTYYSLEDENYANWLRYMRPAKSKNDRNVAIVICENNVFFVTSTTIANGDELVYWSDDCNSSWGKKKIEKISE